MFKFLIALFVLVNLASLPVFAEDSRGADRTGDREEVKCP